MATISFKRTAAFVAAFGIALTPATAGIALAQETTVVNVPADNGGIQFTNEDGTPKTGSLKIVKKLLGSDQTAEDPATGEEMTGIPGAVLGGVTFKVQKVTNADLSSNEGWANASKIANGQMDPTLDTGVSKTTFQAYDDAGNPVEDDNNGIVTFNDLDLGLYLVTETDVPEGVVPGKPFYVFVPMTSFKSDGSGTTDWNYNPVVYPKNTESNVTKEVQDADQNVGDSITYTITSDIPALAGEATISKYEVYDDLDEEQLTTTAGQITVGLTDGTTFEQGIHYTVVVDPTTQAVSIEFTQAGREALTAEKKQDAAVQVVTTIKATVSEIGASDGVVMNQAKTVTNNGGGGGDTHTPSNEVKTTWGKLIVNKTNESKEKLKGATFELYRCSADGVLEDSNTETQEVDPLTVNGQTAWTTDANGALTVDGLHVTNIENNDIPIENNYCLVETQAPVGYAKLVDPIPFKLAGETNVSYTADVVNVDDDDFLPSTGGMGVGLIIAVGAGLIGAGAYAARRNSQTA